MTKKELKIIQDGIDQIRGWLTDDEIRSQLTKEDVIDLEARANAIEWVLVATGYLEVEED